jgi:hypothetical protein
MDQRHATMLRPLADEEPPAGDMSGASAPVLNQPLLARIHQLNRDYLELLVAEHAAADCATQLQHLPVRARAAIASLSHSARQLLAQTSYTLYSLGFEDEGLWQAACERAAQSDEVSVVQRYTRAGNESAQCAFSKIALLHAWHVAATNRLAARVVYAMPDATARRLVAAPLWQVRCKAADHPELLMPRWPTNPAFWPDLVRFAASGDTRRLATVQLLGSQLIAAELELSSAGRGLRAAPVVASPRLRARKVALARIARP